MLQMGIRSVKQTPEVPDTVPGTMGRPGERWAGKEEGAELAFPLQTSHGAPAAP